jgi:hypothetical protein
VTGSKRDKDVQTMASAHLGISHHPFLFERIMQPQRRFPHGLERRRLSRVQIKDGYIGIFEIGQMGTPQMKFKSSLFGEPEQACYRVDQWQWNGMADGLGLVLHPSQPVGCFLRTIA